MQFQLFHDKFFDAQIGSYSLVTEREEFDSQITLTDAEAEMVIEYFGKQNIHVGGVATNKTKSLKQFVLYPSFKIINLNLVFPKPNKPELRLYISSRAGFKPTGGEIWFTYINKGDALVIGSMPQNIWNALDQEDPEDSTYLDQVEETITTFKIKTPPTPKITERLIGSKKVYERNPLIASFSLKKSNYTCDIDPNHKTFVALKNSMPFVEAHHFVPMKYQSDFTIPVDCVENVISLCPNCHRGIHLGIVEHKKNLVEIIFKKRGAINNFEINDLYSFYNLISP
jgi:5-methylcytosine-specific restriction protein A